MFHGLGQDISCIKCLVASDLETLFKRSKRSGHSWSLGIAFKWGFNMEAIWKDSKVFL